MPPYRCTYEMEVVVDAPTPADAARIFRDRHGSLPETVDGIDVLELCRTCGAIVVDDEYTFYDAEVVDGRDVYTCRKCWELAGGAPIEGGDVVAPGE